MRRFGLRMTLRSQRISDLVTAVCIPITMVMYLHMMLLPPVSHPSYSEYRDSTASGPFAESVTAADDEPPQTSDSLRLGPPLNITGNANEDLLLMTPLLRCGATTVRNLLKFLKKDNHFEVVSKPPKKAEVVHIPNVEAQNALASKLVQQEGPTAVLQSFAYINFTQFNLTKPIHISVVREPIERAISWFYHVRAPFQLIERHNRFPETSFPTRAFLKKDLETCLKDRRDRECRYIPGREVLGHTIEFFCGHEPFCPIFASPEGFRRAKEVVEKEFAVVGILEEWPKTLAVLEHYIPRYFKGASDIYFKEMHGNKILTNQNFYKPRVEEKAREYLGRNFTIELEFYDFLKQRLDRQYRAIAASLPST
ncbi:heparan sulfate 2-O-sulfotransferase pipe-like [Macrobrachium rosenbergii]|uniref:heparan sulfate 2-O-sulfotransferase pipe-like n=1 Tax=Macrobrachium rosenbergii TaxID=79674 RepID=UPI0034D7659E